MQRSFNGSHFRLIGSEEYLVKYLIGQYHQNDKNRRALLLTLVALYIYIYMQKSKGSAIPSLLPHLQVLLLEQVFTSPSLS